ncbi:sortase, partial [Clavibacter michiganensis]
LTAELEAGGADVATGRGAVVWSPGADPAPTPVAAVMPLTVPPSASDFVDAEALATYTAAGGTLTRQLDAVYGRPVAVGIDPRIVASIRILGADAPASAVEWLQRLREMPNETFALAWADADVAVQAQAGATTLLAPTDATYAVQASRFAAPGSTPAPSSTPTGTPAPTESPAASGTRGGSAVAEAATSAPEETSTPSEPDPSPTPTAPALAPVPSLADLTAWDYTISGVSWPAAGTVTSGDLGVLAASGTTTAILASGDVQSTGSAAVGATGTIGDTTVLVTDARVSALVDRALSAETDEAFGIALAQLSATLAADARAADGHVVVAGLERGWAASGGRLGQLLDAIQGLPFSDTTELGAAFATAPVPLQVVDHPEDATRVQRVADAMSLEAQVDAFAKAVESPELITGQQRMLLLATLANRWRDDPDGLVTVQDGYTAQADALLGSVAITTRQNTVISDTTSLLINVSNELDQPVTVRLSIIAGSGRIRVDDSALVTVPAHGSASARPPITSISNGDVVVTARLTTEDGTVQIGDSAPVELFIRAGFEAIVTTLFVAAVALLFGFGLFRSIRKRRRARARQLAGLPEEIDD